MIVDAEKETGAVWQMENDPRITKVGKFLRATRIDELPQLINVLKGEMSLIGPRPEREIFIQKFCESNPEDRKSTRLNSSHVRISYAVFCLKKKRKKEKLNKMKE